MRSWRKKDNSASDRRDDGSIESGGTQVAPFPVYLQLNPVSLLDEGCNQILDIAQDKGAATGVVLALHGFNPEVMDRGATWPGHGPRGSHGSLGGTFAPLDDANFAGLRVGSPEVKDARFAGFNALGELEPEATRRGLETHIYILESASTGGWQKNVRGWVHILEIDAEGRRGRMPCVNHPDYRGWKLALLESVYKAYRFDGLLWGVERWGPFHQTLAGGTAYCFCPHCAVIGGQHGLDWRRVREGYMALAGAVADAAIDSAAVLRVLLRFPEILAWEHAWTESYLSLHRELYGAVKWLAPERKFGLGLWHYYMINPVLRAEWDMASFARYCDYLRPILYHLPEGPRAARHYGQLTKSLFRGAAIEDLWRAFAGMLGLNLPAMAAMASTGMPGEFVGQGVRTVRAACADAVPVIAGLGIDVFEHGLDRAMEPADAAAGLRAAVAAGCAGITLSRNYAEMRIDNIAAVGQTLRELGLARR